MDRLKGWVKAVLIVMLSGALGVLVGLMCGCDTEPECEAGQMRCNGAVSQMCSADETWKDYQDCGSIGDYCYITPAQCSGLTGIACCR